MDGEATNSDADVFLKANQLTLAGLDHLKDTPLQRCLSRAVYADCTACRHAGCVRGDDVVGRLVILMRPLGGLALGYEQSLRECFGDSAALPLALHNAHLQQVLGSSPALVRFVAQLQQLRPW